MAVGVLVGLKFFPEKYKKYNNWFQLGCTALLIFLMGVTLGSKENFFEQLSELGLQALILTVLPILCSAAVVYLLTRNWDKK
jgi:uncharacterized transporter YbjL